jgi:hypothetical protein
MKYILALFILIGLSLNSTYAQSDAVLAKSYFLKAQEAYSNGDNSTAMERLDQTLEYLGSTNAKIEALYVKIALSQKDYETAGEHLSNYFEKADESRSDYMEMLGYVADIEEKRRIAEEKSRSKQKLHNEVAEYFEMYDVLCCDYYQQISLKSEWSGAKGALQSVLQESVDGSSIQNDTLYRSLSSFKMPLEDYESMVFEVHVPDPGKLAVTSTTLTIQGVQGNSVEIMIQGKINPSYINKVNEKLSRVAKQKRIIKYLRENPNDFPEHRDLLTLHSYLLAYDGREEYDIDNPQGEPEEAQAAAESTPTTSQPAEKEKSNWETLRKNSYKIDYPMDWSLNQDDIDNGEFVLSTPDLENNNENAVLRMEAGDINEDITLTSYEQIFINGYLKQNFTNVSVLKSERKTINNYSCQNILCEVKSANNLELLFWTRIIIHENKLYLLLFASKPEDFSKHEDTVKYVLNSFTFI